MRMGMRGAQGAPAAQELEYLISGKRARMNMAGPMGGMSLLVLPADKKIYMLVPAQNTYMEMPMGDVANTAAGSAPAGVQMIKTGRMETVAGYRCEHVELVQMGPDGAPQKTDACLSKELGGFANPMSGMGTGKEPAWQKALQAQGFPLKVTTPDGAVALEVVKIEKKRLANDLFSVPLTYTKMARPQRL
jgi:hypothetical protein